MCRSCGFRKSRRFRGSGVWGFRVLVFFCFVKKDGGSGEGVYIGCSSIRVLVGSTWVFVNLFFVKVISFIAFIGVGFLESVRFIRFLLVCFGYLGFF